MAKRGQRLFACDECKERRYVHWTETSRAKRLTCDRCGSARMEIVTYDGKKERAARLDFIASGGTPSAPAGPRKED